MISGQVSTLGLRSWKDPTWPPSSWRTVAQQAVARLHLYLPVHMPDGTAVRENDTCHWRVVQYKYNTCLCRP